MPRRPANRQFRVAVAAAATLLAISACTAQAPPPLIPLATDDPAAAGPVPAPSVARDVNPNGGYWPASIRAASNERLGDTVEDSDGFTLYRWDGDSADPPESRCADACAELWPPVLTRNKIIFKGLDRELLGAIERPDGSLQVTIAGRPAYRYSGDTGPGGFAGEAVDGTWFAFAPDGRKANGDD
ncbi:putative lipoprotein with Yx(FWY)xxD motif [Catenuloplanes nepalensis]|uniref:Lipoprotein with Yx(FWY)xxD motif n=1 Tax=Catenuloplanes nepalensis TaxID=587533 RepID=A0ABT9MMQ8_9ACTN|nr:hypothetical protein [Catenuloplanes nepalensis]MDP9792712.1 putative lipoprotein with Yx(FWY)xxD motif [Catenuloplanes nepalensis]